MGGARQAAGTRDNVPGSQRVFQSAARDFGERNCLLSWSVPASRRRHPSRNCVVGQAHGCTRQPGVHCLFGSCTSPALRSCSSQSGCEVTGHRVGGRRAAQGGPRRIRRCTVSQPIQGVLPSLVAVQVSSLCSWLRTIVSIILKNLRSGHLQTAYAVIGDFSKVDRVEYDRQVTRVKWVHTF